MRKLVLLAILSGVLTSGFLISCGDKTKKDPDEDSAGGLSIIGGSWQTDCLPNTSPYAGPAFMRRIVDIKGSTISHTYQVFQGAACSSLQVTIVKKGKYSHQSLQTQGVLGNEGLYNFDENLNNFSIRPANRDVANGLARSEYCGRNMVWVADKATSVTGRVCDGVFFKATTYYNLMKIDKTASPATLTFGKIVVGRDGSTKEKRPSELNTSEVFQ